MVIPIPEFISFEEQVFISGNKEWSVIRLVELSKDLPVMEIPLVHLSVGYNYNGLFLRDMVMHIKAVLNADLSYPIILDEDGDLMDGRHRVMKAILNKQETIKAVRFDFNPIQCRITER